MAREGTLAPREKMTRSIRGLAFTAILCVAGVGSAATNDFYLSLLQRGIGHVKSSNFDAASRELRIAAFGLVDSIPQFEIAQVYLTIASERLKNESDARHAAQRLLAAERIEPRYAALSIPDDVRTEFERIVTRILTSDQVAVLHAHAVSSPLPAPIVAQPVAPIVTPPPQPAPKLPAPITAQPVAPIVVAPPPPAAVRPKPQPQPVPAPPPTRVVAPQKALADADAALSRDDLAGARTIYRALLENASLDHATLLRVAEGAYRSRDFTTATRAFDRIGALRNGEEPYHYYHAVALYETGRYNAAKRELAAAIPFIEITPDVARYRVKIEGAIE